MVQGVPEIASWQYTQKAEEPGIRRVPASSLIVRRREGIGWEMCLTVAELLKVNPKIMTRRIYKASELKRILMT